jgi:hypothetical protein
MSSNRARAAAAAILFGLLAGAARAEDAKRVRGSVLDVQAGIVTLDVGREGGVTARLVFDVYQPARVVKLPMTAETAYVSERVVAQLVVVDIDNKTARAKIMPPTAGQPSPAVQKGDQVVSNPYALARNIAPDVRALTATPARTQFGTPVALKADWTDEKEDQDYFEWQCTGGTLSHERSAVAEAVWTPPVAKGTYKVSVTAVDTAGNRTLKSIDIESAGVAGPGRNVYEARRNMADHRQPFAVCRDLAFDEQNTAYVIDSKNTRVLGLSNDWELTLRTEDASVSFDLDRLVVRNGELFATDLYAKRGVKLRVSPKMFQEAPAVTFGQEGVGNGQFDAPRDIAVDDKGMVYILDASEKRPCVQIFTPEGEFVASLGSLGKNQGQLGKPVGIGIAHDGTLYVLDDSRKRVLVYKAFRLALEFEAGGQTDVLADLKVDPMTGRVCVLEAQSGQVRSFSPQGQPLEKTFGAQGEALGLGVFNQPRRLKFDQLGGLYVISSEGKVISRCDPAAGEELARWGGIDFTSAKAIAAGPSGDVAVLLKKFCVNLDRRGWTKAIFGYDKLQSPVAIAVGAAGDIAVADQESKNIQVYTPRGALKGAIGKPGKSDREVSSPIDLAADPTRRYLALLEERDQWNVKVFDFDGNLKAAFPGLDGYLDKAMHVAMTERFVHVALKGGDDAALRRRRRAREGRRRRRVRREPAREGQVVGEGRREAERARDLEHRALLRRRAEGLRRGARPRARGRVRHQDPGPEELREAALRDRRRLRPRLRLGQRQPAGRAVRPMSGPE